MSKTGLALLVVAALATGCAFRLSPAETLVDEAAVKISQGNLSDAEPLLKKAIAQDPNLGWAHYNLGSCLHARRAFDDAIGEYRQAISLFGEKHFARSAALYGIASALDDANDWQAAVQAYEAFLQFAATSSDDANGAAMARARIVVLRDAMTRGLPSRKPLRGAALIVPTGSTPPAGPEVAPPADAVPGAAPPMPPPAVVPAPATPKASAPKPAVAPAKAGAAPKGWAPKPAAAPAKADAKAGAAPKGWAPKPAAAPAKADAKPAAPAKTDAKPAAPAKADAKPAAPVKPAAKGPKQPPAKDAKDAKP
jgi:tetratricopeptide (TPR) repeat protein